MSAQINLYHPRFLKQREPLTLRNVLLATAAVYAALAVTGGWAWREAEARKAAAAIAEAQLKSTKVRMEATIKAAATRKPSPQLIAELDGVEASLRRRGDIARLLESGLIGSTGGFSEYLRGLARQVPEGLWLTGFKIAAGGNDLEIHGKMLNPAALPDYIRRLGTEKAFQGRNFAELTMSRSDSNPLARPAAQAATVASGKTAPASAPQPIDFSLMPKLAEAKEIVK